MLRLFKKSWLENKRQARTVNRKMTAQQRQIEAWLSNSDSLEEIERKQRLLTRAGDDLTKLEEYYYRGKA